MGESRRSKLSDIPSVRQEQIVEWLAESRTLSIEELTSRLNVSIMTVHRDIDQLVQAGLVEKVRGGVKLSKIEPQEPPHKDSCQVCGNIISTRSTFMAQTDAGETLSACCSHCGFLLLSEGKTITVALTKDFIYGRMVNVWQATYLLESEITLCCMPSVLCFSCIEDAMRFQKGFGGKVATFQATFEYLISSHRISNHNI